MFGVSELMMRMQLEAMRLQEAQRQFQEEALKQARIQAMQEMQAEVARRKNVIDGECRRVDDAASVGIDLAGGKDRTAVALIEYDGASIKSCKPLDI